MSVTSIKQSDANYAGYTEAMRWMVLFALMLGSILEALDTSIVNVAIPTMMGNFGATVDEINWVSTAYMISNVVILPLTGWLSAYFGRRNYLAGSIILFTISSFFCGISTSLNMLILFRVLQGVGGAALLSTAMATLLEIFPPEQQGMVLGVFGIGVMTIPTIGPAIGGWITDNYSWNWIFFINIPIGVLSATLTLLFMRDSIHAERGASKVDWWGMLFLTVGLGCLQTFLEKGTREDWFQSDLICWLFTIAVINLILLVWRELSIDYPVVNLRALRNRSLSAGSVISIVLGVGLYGSIFLLPLFLQNIRGYTAFDTGKMLITMGVASAISMGVVGKLTNRFSARSLVAVGCLSFLAAMYLLKSVTMDTGPEQIFNVFLLEGFALGLLFIPLSLATLGGLKGQEMADGSGIFNLTRQWGGSLGIALLSTYLDHSVSYHRAILVNHANIYNPLLRERIQAYTQYLMHSGSPYIVAYHQAFGILDGVIQLQSNILAFEDAFLAIGIAFILILPLLLFLRNTKGGGGMMMH